MQTEQILKQFCTNNLSYHVPEMCFNHNGACARSTDGEDSYHLAWYQNTQIFWSHSQALISHEPVIHMTSVRCEDPAVASKSVILCHGDDIIASSLAYIFKPSGSVFTPLTELVVDTFFGFIIIQPVFVHRC
jgi:hypothetical protein